MPLIVLSTCAAPGVREAQAEAPTPSLTAAREAPRTDAGKHSRDTAQPELSAAPEDSRFSGPLAAFHRALMRTRERGDKTRVLFFGDSHTAADYMTGRVRERLQTAFGDGGPGFLLTGRPWRSARHDRMELLSVQGLHSSYIRKRPENGTQPLGLAGVITHAILADAASETPPEAPLFRFRVRPAVKPTGQATQHELYFLQRPAGGTLRITLDGKPVTQVATRAEAEAPGYVSFSSDDDAPHEITLSGDAGHALSWFGMVVERSGPGVVLDTLGIPGARARAQLYWEPNLLREHVQKRVPDLFVLAYGTNESTDVTQPIGDYATNLNNAVAQLRDMLPEASCLLVGPTDFPEKVKKGEYRARERTSQINALQKSTAERFGCAFFDVLETMGGPLSMLTWASASPPLGAKDLVHLTRPGYVLVGERIADFLLQGVSEASKTEVSQGTGRR